MREIDLHVLRGTLLCCRSAIRLMASRRSGAHVFNMLGAGSDGGATQKYAAYGRGGYGAARRTRAAGEREETAPSVGVTRSRRGWCLRN